MTPQPVGAAVLVAHGLAAGYREAARPAVLSGIDLELGAGSLVCVVGPNGVGKSTLLRTLSGLQPALAGEVLLMDRPLGSWDARERARHIAIVLTAGFDAGYMSVWSLVALGRFPYAGGWGRLRSEDRRIVADALRSVGILELAQRPFARLSDGERQKTLIARALAQNPILLVLDEPTAYLDVTGRAEIMHTLRRLSRSAGHAVAVSTHDIELAMHTADLFWLIDGDGVVKVGAPEDLALSGDLRRVFTSTAVRFDEESGSFRLHAAPRATARVRGAGIAAEWTARALTRLGYTLIEGRRDRRAAQVTIELSARTPDRGTAAAVAGFAATAHGRFGFGSIAELAAILARQTARGEDEQGNAV